MSSTNYNTKIIVWDEHYSTDLAVFFTVNDLMLLAAFFVLKHMLDKYCNKMVEERKKLIIVYGVFVSFTTAQVIFLLAYGHYRNLVCNAFRRHLVGNCLNIVWDFPIIILVCHSHYINFRENPINKSTNNSNKTFEAQNLNGRTSINF